MYRQLDEVGGKFGGLVVGGGLIWGLSCADSAGLRVIGLPWLDERVKRGPQTVKGGACCVETHKAAVLPGAAGR